MGVRKHRQSYVKITVIRLPPEKLAKTYKAIVLRITWNMGQEKDQQRECRLCGRQVSFVSKHHLLPKQQGGKHTQTVELCQPCHSTIHLTFSNQQLARDFSTIAELQQAEPLQKYLHWIRDKHIDSIRNRRGKKR